MWHGIPPSHTSACHIHVQIRHQTFVDSATGLRIATSIRSCKGSAYRQGQAARGQNKKRRRRKRPNHPACASFAATRSKKISYFLDKQLTIQNIANFKRRIRILSRPLSQPSSLIIPLPPCSLQSGEPCRTRGRKTCGSALKPTPFATADSSSTDG